MMDDKPDLPPGSTKREPASALASIPAPDASPELTGTYHTQSSVASQKPPAATCPLIAGYEVLRELGRGGMGVVYLARQVTLRRLVALKVVRGADTAETDELARFRAEAAVIARLRHPNIVQVYELGEWSPAVSARRSPFIALEYVEGGSLALHLRGTPQPPRAAAELVQILAAAMQTAHEQGIVHRDLKPANVLLAAGRAISSEEPGGSTRHDAPFGGFQPKITDFGLARCVDTAGRHTQTGAVLGTPSYMAPEQARGHGKAAGPAADIYALGAILYECLTGRPPFRGPTVLDTLEQVCTQEPLAPSRLQPKVPRDLETICLKCLQKPVAARYATAGELAADLQRFLTGESIHARPAGRCERLWRWSRRHPARAAAATLGLLLAAAVLLLAVGTVFTLGLRQEQEQTELARREAEHQRQLADEERDRADEARRRADLLARSQALDQHLLTCEKGDVSRGLLRVAAGLAEAPDGAGELRHVYRMNVAAWGRLLVPIQALIPSPVQTWPGWMASPIVSVDGKRILTAAGRTEAQLWDALTGQPVGAPLRHESALLAAAFSPDGRTVLTGSQDGAVRIHDADSGNARGEPLMTGGAVIALYHSPDGKVFLTAHEGTARLWDSATIRPIGAPLPNEERPQVWNALFSPDGKTLATRSDDSPVGDVVTTVHLWRTATGERIGQPLAYNVDVDLLLFSPDSRFLLVGSRGTVMGRTLGQLVDTATATAVDTSVSLRPSAAGGDTLAAFSPDGRALASACADGLVRLVDLPAGKPRGEPLLTADNAPPAARVVRFSPDSQTLVTGHWDNTVRLWSAATGEPLFEPLRHEGNAQLSFTPARGGGAAPLSQGIIAAAFAPSGGTLMTAGADRAVRFWSTATGKPLAGPLSHPGAVTGIRLSPDGRLGISETAEGSGWIWETATGLALGLTPQPQGPYTVKGFGAGGRTVLTGGRDGVLRLLKTAESGTADRMLAHTGNVSAVAFSPDGRTVLTGSTTGLAQLWDTATGQQRGAPLRESSAIIAVGFSPDGRAAWTHAWQSTARLWSTASGEPVGPVVQRVPARFGNFTGDARKVITRDTEGDWLCDLATGKRIANLHMPDELWWKAAFSADGRWVLTGSHAGTAQLWDAATGKPIGPLLRHEATITVLTFSPDGNVALTGSYDRTARLWDAATGTPLAKPLQHRGGVAAAAFSPDGKTILTGCEDQTAQFWDAATGAPLGRPLPHEDYVWTVAVAPGGRVALTGTKAGAYYLWDAATRKPIGAPLQHQGPIADMAFSPDGTRLLTGSADGTGRLWDTATAKPIGPALRHGAPVDVVALSPTGRFAVIGGRSTYTRLLSIPEPLAAAGDAAVRWAQVRTGMELDADGVARWLSPARWQEQRKRTR